MDTEDVVYISNVILLSHKKEWKNTICSSMGGSRAYHTKWSQKEKDKYHMMSLLYGIESMTQVNLSMKQTHRPREHTCGCRGGGGREGMDWEFWISKCKLIYIYIHTHTH